MRKDNSRGWRYVTYALTWTLIGWCGLVRAGSPPPASQRTTEPQREALSALQGLPLSFEVNQGQTDSRVRYLARGAGYALFLTDQEAVLRLASDKSSTLRLQLLNARRATAVGALDSLPGRINYYVGNDPAHWHTDVPLYGKVKFTGVYPGIDLIYHGSQQQLEYDFVVAPGADPSSIALGIRADSSAVKLNVTEEGDLLVETDGKVVRQKRPVAYQEFDGARRAVEARYVLDRRSGKRASVRLALGSYDRTRALTIDPVLLYASYLGGDTYLANLGFPVTSASGVATDATGALYVTGSTNNATDFPKASGVPATSDQFVYVTKIIPTAQGANAVAWTTVIAGTAGVGGSTGHDVATSLALGASGSVYFAGWSYSTNLPTTASAFQRQNGSLGGDGFVGKLDSSGRIAYLTYLSGSSDSQVLGIALDTAERVIAGGVSFNTGTFPTTADAYRRTGASNSNDGFVSVIDTTLSGSQSLVYSTLFGGSNSDDVQAVAVDSQGRIHVAGRTKSTDLPITAGAAQSNLLSASHFNAFYGVLNRSQTGSTTLDYGTYLGGTGSSEARTLALDSSGNGVISGFNEDGGFPITSGAFPAGNPTAPTGIFLSVTAPNDGGAADLRYSTVFSSGTGYRVAVDSADAIWLVGDSYTDFPAVCHAGSGNAFLMVLYPAGNGIADRVFSMQYGGAARGLALEYGGALSRAAIVGQSATAGMLTTLGAVRETVPVGGRNSYGFIDIVDIAGTQGATTITLGSSANPSPPGQALTLTATVSGGTDGTLVTFQDGAAVIGTASLVNGVATLANVVLTAGSHSLTAVYPGDCDTAASTSMALNQLIGTAQSQVTLQASPNPAAVGQTVNLLAQVSGSNPTGTVDFLEGATVLGTGTLAGGIASFSISTLPLGSHQITAHYNGDTGNSPSTSSPVTVTITNAVDLAVAIGAAPSPASVSQSLVYTIRVSNLSPFGATGVTVFHSLPGNAAFNGVFSASQGTCAINANPVVRTLQCDLGALAANGQALITATVTPNVSASLTSSASVRGNEADPSQGNNSATVTTLVDAADLAVTLSDSPDPVGLGTSLTYTIGVANIGPSTAPSASITFANDASLTLSSIGGTGLTGVGCGGSGIQTTCSIGSLPSGAQGTITLTYTTSTVGTISATATISSSQVDPVASNNTATETTVVNSGSADLAVAITAPDPVTTGQQPFAYTITVINHGPSPAVGARMLLEQPTSFQFSFGSGTGVRSCHGPFSPSNLSICVLDDVPAGGQIVITLGEQPTQLGKFTVTARVDSAVSDPDSSNNQVSWLTTVAPIADLEMQPIVVGSKTAFLTYYSFQVKNLGPDLAYSGASGDVRVHLQINEGGTISVIKNGADWQCTQLNPTEADCTYGPDLAIGQLSGPSSQFGVIPTAARTVITATAIGPPSVGDPPGNNVATVALANGADLEMQPIVVGSKTAFLTYYSFQVKNLGPDLVYSGASGDVRVHFQINEGGTISFIKNDLLWPCTQLSPTEADCTYVGPPDLAAGQLSGPSSQFGVISTAARTVVTATATGPPNVSDPQDNNVATLTVANGADLEMQPIEIGTQTAFLKFYGLQLKNLGPDQVDSGASGAVRMHFQINEGGTLNFIKNSSTWQCTQLSSTEGDCAYTGPALLVGQLSGSAFLFEVIPTAARTVVTATAIGPPNVSDPQGNNVATLTVANGADLELQPISLNKNYAGRGWGYFVYVKNLGPDPIPTGNIRAHFEINQGAVIRTISPNDWSCTQAGTADVDCLYTYAGGPLLAGQVVVSPVIVEVNQTGSPVVVTETTSGPPGVDDPQGNNTETHTDTNAADLEMQPIGLNKNYAGLGGWAYFLNVQNLGPDPVPAGNIRAHFEINQGAVIRTISANDWSCTQAGTTGVDCLYVGNGGALLAGQPGITPIIVEVNQTGSSVVVTATASGLPPPADPQGNNTQTRTDTNAADLEMQPIGLNKNYAGLGGWAYFLNVQNLGPDPIPRGNVRVHFEINQGAVISRINPNDWSCTQASTTGVDCLYVGNGGALLAGQPGITPIIVEVNQEDSSVVVTATASGLPPPADPQGNNVATLTTSVVCASEATAGIFITRSGYRYVRALGRYVETVTLTNSTAFPIAGPVSLVVDGLSSNVAVVPDGTTSCTAPPATPYRSLNVGADNILTPGESANVVLSFIDPSNVPIGYTVRVVANGSP